MSIASAVYAAPLGIVLLILVIAVSTRLRVAPLPYPPGPPKHPLWGNYRDTPSGKPWYRFTEWKKEYGDLVHFSVLGHHNIIINSPEIAEELLSKRSSIYSDRPHVPMIKLSGWDINIGLLPYGDKWRAHRRVFQQAFNAKVIQSYRPLQSEKLHAFLNELLDRPGEMIKHAHKYTSSVIIKIVYGHEITGDGPDRLIDATESAIDYLAEALIPGAWLVNSLPILQYLPKWFPGCRTFNEFAEISRSTINIMSRESYSRAKEYAQDKACLVTILEDMKVSPDATLQVTDDVYIDVCGTAYAAGAETTKTALDVFFLMMCIHPEVQQKAYEEITRVTGSHRLPAFEDRPLLPYVEAILREVMRWMPVTPLAAPHYTTQDDMYQGYYIPKGCTILANVWAMCNDELKYPEPRRFLPERFLTPEGTINDDDRVLAFGFGRRICVGRHFADASVWWTMVTLLAGFLITQPNDEEQVGQHLTEAQAEDMFTEGIILSSKPFRCSASPRNEEVVKMIRNLSL